MAFYGDSKYFNQPFWVSQFVLIKNVNSANVPGIEFNDKLRFTRRHTSTWWHFQQGIQ